MSRLTVAYVCKDPSLPKTKEIMKVRIAGYSEFKDAALGGTAAVFEDMTGRAVVKLYRQRPNGVSVWTEYTVVPGERRDAELRFGSLKFTIALHYERPAPAPRRSAPAPRRLSRAPGAYATHRPNMTPCRNWRDTGRCTYGDSCHVRH